MKQKIIFVLLAGILILTACGGADADATPTLSPEQLQTQAVETFSAGLTQTAIAAPPTQTPFPTLTASPTFAPFATPTAGTPLAPPTSAGTSSQATCYGLTFVSDVSIPDNTQMTPGQTFTKTWKVLNSGSCTWDAGFKFAFTTGNALGGTTVALSSAVASGAQYDISVPMTAPSTAGTYQSNWRMQTAGGQFFGNEVYVVIVVGGAGTTSTPPTSTPVTATAETTTP